VAAAVVVAAGKQDAVAWVVAAVVVVVANHTYSAVVVLVVAVAAAHMGYIHFHSLEPVALLVVVVPVEVEPVVADSVIHIAWVMVVEHWLVELQDFVVTGYSSAGHHWQTYRLVAASSRELLAVAVDVAAQERLVHSVAVMVWVHFPSHLHFHSSLHSPLLDCYSDSYWAPQMVEVAEHCS